MIRVIDSHMTLSVYSQETFLPSNSLSKTCIMVLTWRLHRIFDVSCEIEVLWDRLWSFFSFLYTFWDTFCDHCKMTMMLVISLVLDVLFLFFFPWNLFLLNHPSLMPSLSCLLISFSLILFFVERIRRGKNTKEKVERTGSKRRQESRRDSDWRE